VRELGAASEDDVVLAFLRAEIDSPQWGPHYSSVLRSLNLDRASLIDDADIEDIRACANRRTVLGRVRGYGWGKGLFTGFPSDVTWRRVQVEPPDFHRLKTISKDEQWTRLTTGTRLIQEAARNLETYPERAAGVLDTLKKIQGGLAIAELIMVEDDADDFVLVEGHTRATAYAVLSHPFESFVGTSPSMTNWHFI
jgi:hypothetical protein